MKQRLFFWGVCYFANMLVFTNRGEVSKIAAGSRSLTAISHFDLHTSQLAQPNQYLTRQGFSPPTHHSQPLFRVVQPCTLSTTMEPAAVPGPGPVEALVSTPVPRGTPVAMTPLQPTPLSAEDTPDLLLREGLLEPVLCPVFRQLDAEANVPEGTVSATCTARILTGPKRGKVCGKPTKAGHLCGLHGPTRNRKRQQKRNAPIDGVDVAALGLPLVSKKAEQCRFMCPGAAGRPDVQCQRKTRDPSNVCHCHRNAAPRKTRKYTHVPVALRERAISAVVANGLSYAQAARRLGLPRQTVHDVVRHYELTGETTRTSRHSKPPNLKVTEEMVAFVRQQVWPPKLRVDGPGGDATLTLRGLCDLVLQKFGTRLSIPTMQRVLTRDDLQFSCKKLRIVSQRNNCNVRFATHHVPPHC